MHKFNRKHRGVTSGMVFVAILCTTASPHAAEEPVIYTGTLACDNVYVSVTFKKQSDDTITDFKAAHGCAGENPSTIYEPKAVFGVGPDNTFSHSTPDETGVTGTFEGSKATGTFSAQKEIQCNTEKISRTPCANWRVENQGAIIATAAPAPSPKEPAAVTDLLSDPFEASEPRSTQSSPTPTPDTSEENETPERSGNSRGRVGVGLNIGLGVTATLGNFWDEEVIQAVAGPNARKTAGVAFLFDFGFDINLSERWAIFSNLGMVIKGTRIKNWYVDGYGEVDSVTDNVLFLELPIGAKLNLSRFQLGLGLAAYFAIAGWTRVSDGEESDDVDWDDETWEIYRRVNLGPKLHIGYASSGPATYIVAMDWSMHLLSDIVDPTGELDSSETQSRYMSFIFKIGMYLFVNKRSNTDKTGGAS